MIYILRPYCIKPSSFRVYFYSSFYSTLGFNNTALFKSMNRF
nr:MAG TPA: hypothetical protein [Bacteriophage sp.]